MAPTPTLPERLKRALQTPLERRDYNWVVEHLQTAVELELSTIPPYLTACWSIITPNAASAMIAQVAQMEMLHMGWACNSLNALNARPRIAFRDVVPTYPAHLPGGVHVDLLVPLQRFSLDALARTFMMIEEPTDILFVEYRGDQWPTIGAFYTALLEAVARLPESAFGPDRKQVTSDELTPSLTSINCRADCLTALESIQQQGEGTSASPLFGQDPLIDLAHYYVFGQILNGRHFVQVNGQWAYGGDPIPYLNWTDVYPMATIPRGGYRESYDFDILYSALLRELQAVWDDGDSNRLDKEAVPLMRDMKPIARDLMQLPICGGCHTYGPSFLFLE